MGSRKTQIRTNQRKKAKAKLAESAAAGDAGDDTAQVQAPHINGARDPRGVTRERPCEHNEWISTDRKPAYVTLRCLACMAKWKTVLDWFDRCPYFHNDALRNCPHGAKCEYPHIYARSRKHDAPSQVALREAQQAEVNSPAPSALSSGAFSAPALSLPSNTSTLWREESSLTCNSSETFSACQSPLFMFDATAGSLAVPPAVQQAFGNPTQPHPAALDAQRVPSLTQLPRHEAASSVGDDDETDEDSIEEHRASVFAALKTFSTKFPTADPRATPPEGGGEDECALRHAQRAVSNFFTHYNDVL